MASLLNKWEASDPVMLGRTWAILNTVFQAVLNFSSKKMEHTDGASIVIIRSIIGLAISYSLIVKRNIPAWPVTDFDKNTHFIRMMFGGVGTVLLHTGLTMLPLQMMMVMVALNVPMNVFLLLMLGKTANIQVWICVILTFVGVIMVVNPGLIGLEKRTYTADQISITGIIIGIIVPLLYASNRLYLSGRNLDSNVNVFIFSIAGLLGAGVTRTLESEFGFYFCLFLIILPYIWLITDKRNYKSYGSAWCFFAYISKK